MFMCLCTHMTASARACYGCMYVCVSLLLWQRACVPICVYMAPRLCLNVAYRLRLFRIIASQET